MEPTKVRFRACGSLAVRRMVHRWLALWQRKSRHKEAAQKHIRGPHKPGFVLASGIQTDRPALGNHSSRHGIAPMLKQPTRTSRERNAPTLCHPKTARARGPYLALLRVGFAVTGPVARPPVRFYRTLSPLPVIADQIRFPSAVCSLWHCP